MNLIDSLVAEGWLKNQSIIEAFQKVKRVDFLPESEKSLAEFNEAMPIGYGQTISQPLVVAFMLELLQPEPGQKILDIGAGSGYTTSLLAQIVSPEENPKSEIPALPAGRRNPKQIQNSKSKIPNGRVIGIEIVPELARWGRNNVAKYNFLEKGIAEIVCADGSKGYEKEAPYDRILASASSQNHIPSAWKTQLKPGGRIVCPINNSIWLFVKKGENEFEEKEFPGFVFVPLIAKS